MVLAGFSFLADIVALFRDRILASHFGASRSLDIYYSAFKIPDFIFNLLVLGALSSAFIPVFLERYRNDTSAAWRLSQNFFTFTLSGVIIGLKSIRRVKPIRIFLSLPEMPGAIIGASCPINIKMVADKIITPLNVNLKKFWLNLQAADVSFR